MFLLIDTFNLREDNEFAQEIHWNRGFSQFDPRQLKIICLEMLLYLDVCVDKDYKGLLIT